MVSPLRSRILVFALGGAFVPTLACRSTITSSGNRPQSAPEPIKDGTGAVPPPAGSAPSAAAVGQPALQLKETEGECLLGLTVVELASSPDFQAQKRGQVVIPSRLASGGTKPKTFAVTDYRHLKSGETYTVYSTFRNEDDGGLTHGWVERGGSSELLAEIRDGGFEVCKIRTLAPSAAPTGGGGGPGCFFGDDLKDLENAAQFSLSPAKERSRLSRLPDEAKTKKKTYAVRQLTHKATGRSFAVYVATDGQKKGSGGATGWIEDGKTAEIVAHVGESEIYRCMINAAGEQRGSLLEEERPCLFGSDLYDLELSSDFTFPEKGDELPLKSRIGDGSRTLTFLKRQITHRPTGRLFVVFNTFKDEDDRGSTLGWIEGPDGGLVAEIHDSQISGCKVP